MDIVKRYGKMLLWLAGVITLIALGVYGFNIN